MAQFWPDWVVTYMARVSHRGAPTLKVSCLCDFFSNTLSSQYCFAKGSRGGTWHVPRGTWRHVTNAIVVRALWRIFWCLSRPDRTIRSAAIHKSPWTDWLTDTHTNRLGRVAKIHPTQRKSPFIRMGLRPFFFITILKIVMKNFEIFSKFFTPKFLLTENVYFGIIRPEKMKIKIFGKIKILTPLIFGPP